MPGVGGHDDLRPDVARTVLVEHRQRRCRGDDLNGVMRAGISGTDRSGEGQDSRSQQRRPATARSGSCRLTARRSVAVVFGRRGFGT